MSDAATLLETPPADPVLDGAPDAVDPTEAARVAAAVPPVAPVVPEQYDVKLPDGSPLDVAIVERTTALARELGLGNEAAQTLLDKMAGEETDRLAAQTKAAEADLAAWKPGGESWKARDDGWRADALKDPEIGGSPEKLQASVTLAHRGLAALVSPEKAKQVTDFFEETGYGSHPMVLSILAAAGRKTQEGALVFGAGVPPAPKSVAERMYPGDGTGPKPEVK